MSEAIANTKILSERLQSTLSDTTTLEQSYFLSTPKGDIMYREISTSIQNLLTLLEEWNIHTQIHDQKTSYPQLSSTIRGHLADYNHRQRVLEAVKPVMTIASIALGENPRLTQGINCPHCHKYFSGRKFWKRFHQHRRDAHPNHNSLRFIARECE